MAMVTVIIHLHGMAKGMAKEKVDKVVAKAQIEGAAKAEENLVTSSSSFLTKTPKT